MEANKKTLLKGVAIGVVVTILIVFTVTSVYANFFNTNYTVEEKIQTLMSVIDKYYVNDADKDKMYEAMYKGLIAGVDDKYTVYMDKDTYTSFKESTDGAYAGIGATVENDTDDSKVTIVSTFPGSPSDKAGIKKGDKILKVNDINVSGDKLDEATTIMKGKPGSTVKVTILQKDTGKTVDLDVVREHIDIPTINYKMMDNNVGYIRIIGFDGVTTDQYFSAFKDLQSQGMKKLVLDLRDNPGGRLDVVSKIADSIVPKGVIVYTEDKNGKRNYTYSKDDHIEIPLVVLVNGNSASASEVLTEAIKDYGVGTVVGTQTYGKGVVQSLIPLNDGSAVKVTIAKYYSPKGYCIHGVGITPDVIVPYDEDANGTTFDLAPDKDVQLQKALELINSPDYAPPVITPVETTPHPSN